MSKLGLEKEEEAEIKLLTFADHKESMKFSQSEGNVKVILIKSLYLDPLVIKLLENVLGFPGGSNS